VKKVKEQLTLALTVSQKPINKAKRADGYMVFENRPLAKLAKSDACLETYGATSLQV
jgi:hypothetical protein